MTRKRIKYLDWHNLYRDSWKKEIVADAFVHPAKFSRSLIRQIYAYLLDQAHVKPGDTVIDPFAGVALGALDAMANGLNWVGVELEPKFVDLGERNIALWNKRYAGKMARWGTARLLQGDSRRLAEDEGFNAAISSPPYADGGASEITGVDDTPAKRQSTKKSRPKRERGYTAAISSPPYANESIAKNSKSIDRQKQYETYRASGGGASFEKFCKTQDAHSLEYGETPGQLGAMKAGEFTAAVSSPPYEGIRQDGGGDYAKSGVGGIHPYTDESVDTWFTQRDQRNLGNVHRDDFWHASRTIVEQVHAVVAPGAVAVWVVKDFVRAKRRVPFCDQWRQLCEACGFETVAIARAWLVEDKGTTIDLDGNHHKRQTERKSFFRRLAEKNGSPRIDYEQVIIMRKPRGDSS